MYDTDVHLELWRDRTACRLMKRRDAHTWDASREAANSLHVIKADENTNLETSVGVECYLCGHPSLMGGAGNQGRICD